MYSIFWRDRFEKNISAQEEKKKESPRLFKKNAYQKWKRNY